MACAICRTDLAAKQTRCRPDHFDYVWQSGEVHTDYHCSYPQSFAIVPEHGSADWLFLLCQEPDVRFIHNTSQTQASQVRAYVKDPSRYYIGSVHSTLEPDKNERAYEDDMFLMQLDSNG